jgi:hypothetical protein
MVYLGSTLRSFIVVKPFGSTMKKASKKQVKARNFCGLKIRMYVRIGVTAVKFGTILSRRKVTSVKCGWEERCNPAISCPGSTRSLASL